MPENMSGIILFIRSSIHQLPRALGCIGIGVKGFYVFPDAPGNDYGLIVVSGAIDMAFQRHTES
jgi:hypothetical protein